MNIQIKKIGKIKQADIELGDLTIFVGKNGTNKSYVAHVIYMLNKTLNSLYISNNFFNRFVKNLDFDIESYFEKYKQKENIKIPFEDDNFDIDNTREVIYKFDLHDLEEKILNKIYNSIIDYLTEEVNKSFNTNKQMIEAILFKQLKIDSNELFKNGVLKIRNSNKNYDSTIALFTIFRMILEKFTEFKISSDGYYFPASRTGFVLAFDEIVSGVLRDRFGGKPTATKLTEPTIDFISKFADIKSGKFDKGILRSRFLNLKKDKNLEKVFDFINKKIIFGDIIEEKSEENYTQFFLKPKTSNNNIEMHLASSSVVELLPLIIFLKHFNSLKGKFLVIEEPEAHFHPKSQIEIARLLVMLVNLGAKVLITTHSDYILNEINNCIKLNNVEIEKQTEYLNKLDLPEEIIIEKEKIKAYLFKEQNQKVEVRKLEIDDYGISNENFDDVLDELLDRTEYINMELKL